MSIISAFAGRYSALEYAFGGQYGGPPLTIQTGNNAAGVGTITLITGVTQAPGGMSYSPINVNAPIIVGIGANAETVTPTSVTPGTLSGLGQGVTITATFANVHGSGEPVSSGSFGVQEAINIANGNGSGEIVITQAWYNAGGTTAIIQAATLPTNGSVDIVDIVNAYVWAIGPNSTTAVAAPSAATSATVASLTGVTGTWTAITEHVLFTYITPDGGESLASADYSFTATANLAIGGSGPAASAGAVGYRVYIGANATTTCYLVPAIAANGTVITCGPLACFKLGTPFAVATATVASALIPVTSNSFPTGVQPFASDNMAQSFSAVQGPFAVTGVVTAGTALEWGKLQLPTGFMNFVGRTVRVKLYGYYTPVSGATLILTVALQSVYNTTSTTMFTVTTPASSGTTAANINAEIVLSTATTGTTGTIECHGTVLYGGATGTAGLLVAAGDSVQVASGAVDLTKQDALVVTINSGTANLTQSQLRRMIIEVLV